MSNLELIKQIEKNTNKNIDYLMSFLQQDCQIDIHISKSYLSMDFYSKKSTAVEITYKEKKEANISNNFSTVLSKIISLLDKEDINKIKSKISNCRNTNKNKKRKETEKKVSIEINNNNNNNNNLSNTINIELNNLTNLKSYIKNEYSGNNKEEILNLIKEVENAKKNNNKKDYIDKFLKLLKLISNILNIPPFLIKSVETIKDFFK